MGVPSLCVTGPGTLDLGGVLTEDGDLRGRSSRGRTLETGLGELTGGLGTILGRGPPTRGAGLGEGGNILASVRLRYPCWAD